jgi:hypothetical protein
MGVVLQAFWHILSLPRLSSKDKVPNDTAQNPEDRNFDSNAAKSWNLARHHLPRIGIISCSIQRKDLFVFKAKDPSILWRYALRTRKATDVSEKRDASIFGV